MSWPTLLVLLGTIIAAFGAFWSNHRETTERANFERELRIKSDDQASSQKEISASLAKQLELQRQLNEKATELAKSQGDLALKTAKNAQLTQLSANQQTEITLKTNETIQLVNEIVQAYRDGKLSRQDVEQILKRPLADSLRFEENLGRKVIPGGEKK